MKEKDEIDLLQLLVNVAKAFVSNLKLFIVTFLIGTSGGLVFYQFAPKVYESKIIFDSEVLTFSASRAIVSDLKILIKERNYEELGRLLNLTTEEANQINALQLDIATERPELLKENEKTILIIVAQVTDKTLFPKLQSSLINYLENNEYSQVRERERKKVLQGVIDKITEEIEELEKLRVQFLKGELFPKSSGSTILFDPTEINLKIVDLTKEKLTTQNSLIIASNVQLMQGFTNFKKPVSPKISYSLLGGAFIGMILVIAIIAFKSFKRLLQFGGKQPD